MARATPRKKKVPALPGLALRSRAHQLAEYLRDCLREGRLSTPLPGMRLWSRQLGVSRRTLQATVRELQHEGWLTVQRRGIRLNSRSIKAGARLGETAPRRVRWLLESTIRNHLYSHHLTFGLLQERLSRRGIEFSWETCPPARLRAIARQPANPNELLILASLPPVYQRLFAAASKPALVLGEVASGLTLPFINGDLAGIVRHATFRLLRQGCAHLAMVHFDTGAAGIRSAQASFQAACANEARAWVTSRIFPTALDRTSLLTTMRRLAGGVKDRTGIIVLAPVPLGMVVTALLQHGIAVPAQAEVVGLMHPAEATQLFPPLVHYPWPRAAFARQISRVADVFFTTGILPSGGKMVPIEVAAPT